MNESSHLGIVLILNRDLFFGIRLRNLVTSAGYEAALVPTTSEFVERLQRDNEKIALGVIDMGAEVDWQAIAQITATTAPPLLAFGPHKNVDAFRAAKTAGVTRVMANSEFHRKTLELIQRYARSEQN